MVHDKRRWLFDTSKLIFDYHRRKKLLMSLPMAEKGVDPPMGLGPKVKTEGKQVHVGSRSRLPVNNPLFSIYQFFSIFLII